MMAVVMIRPEMEVKTTMEVTVVMVTDILM